MNWQIDIKTNSLNTLSAGNVMKNIKQYISVASKNICQLKSRLSVDIYVGTIYTQMNIIRTKEFISF